MNVNSAFPSKYLKASDLGTAQPTVIIDHVSIEEVGRDKDSRPVIYFAGKEKGVVLNRTNAKKIAELVGSPETDEWAGFAVRLYATETQFGGDTVECIRIKAAPPKQKATVPAAKPKPKPAPEPEPEEYESDGPDDSEIPFAWLLPLLLPLLGASSLLLV